MSYSFRNKIKIGLVISLAIFLIQSLSAESLEGIDWRKELEVKCENVWGRISPHVDSSLNSSTSLECSRCALLHNDGNLALAYLGVALRKGQVNPLVKDVLSMRSYALLNEDPKAVELLKKYEKFEGLSRILNMPEIEALTNRNIEALKVKNATQPKFDVFTFIVSILSSLGLFFASIILFKRNSRNQGLGWLSLIVMNFSLIMLIFVLYWTKYISIFNYFDGWWQNLYLLVGPLQYFYVSALFGQKKSTVGVVLHLLPFICSVMIGLLGNLYSYSFLILKSDHLLISAFTSSWIKVISLGAYLWLSYIITKGDWEIDVNLKWWSKCLHLFYAIFFIANVSYFSLSNWSGFNTSWDYFISAVMMIGILAITILGYLEPDYLQFDSITSDVKQPSNKVIMPQVGNNESDKEKVPAIMRTEVMMQETSLPPLEAEESITSEMVRQKYKTSNITKSASVSIKHKFEQLMDEKELFKNNELRIQDVADLIGLSRNQLSQVINENYGMGFFDLINLYRVRYAASLLSKKNNPHTVSFIAYEAGFNNKVSFYKSFKKLYNCTPLEFIQKEESKKAIFN
jgi:AraC-like DNA-binding protein